MASMSTIPTCPQHGVPLTEHLTLQGWRYRTCHVCEAENLRRWSR